MSEIGEANGREKTQNPIPPESSNAKERLIEKKQWVSSQRERLERGEIPADIFDANIAMEILSRELEIEQKEQLVDALRAEIYEDSLVEAESEQALQNYLDELVGNHECFGLILGDIDHFRDVNTQAGHQGGDNAIIKVAEKMSRVLRTVPENESDTRSVDRFFRRHGDEFAIVVRNLTPDEEGKRNLKEVMERVRQEVAANPIPLEINGQQTEKQLTVSLGGAVTPKGTSVNPDKFIHLVDKQALYQAKDEGRNTTFVINYDQPTTIAA